MYIWETIIPEIIIGINSSLVKWNKLLKQPAKWTSDIVPLWKISFIIIDKIPEIMKIMFTIFNLTVALLISKSVANKP